MGQSAELRADLESTDAATAMGHPHVRVQGVTKRFGGVVALNSVDVTIERGKIHALVGENGAGKSTLGRLIAGIHAADEGTVLVSGEEARYSSPREALRSGITIIAQELSLVERRSVLENVFLGSEVARWSVVRSRTLRQRFDLLCAEAGFRVDPDALVDDMRVADKQKVEILRALARNAKLIVMDEPTAALTNEESMQLLEIMRSLRDKGTTLVFVSHFLHEVLAVSDTVTVLRDGVIIQSTAAADQTVDLLVGAMLGRAMDTTFPDKLFVAPDAPVRLKVEGLSRGNVVNDISLSIRAGEIVGLAGLVGAGRSEVARAIFGSDRSTAGTVYVDGEQRRIRHPRDGVRAGIAMLPESRKDQGLLMTSSIARNVTLVHLDSISRGNFIAPRTERGRALASTREVGVNTEQLGTLVSNLSGGNQQKVMFAKWLFERPSVLIVDEPTRGVDVGSKRTIYELLVRLAAEGMAILVISSEMEEVLGLAHRVLVMRQGEITAEFEGDHMIEQNVLTAAFAAKDVQE